MRDKNKQVQAQLQREKELRLTGKKRFKTYILKTHLDNDADIIAKLDGLPNKNGYIKSLIRKDIKRRK